MGDAGMERKIPVIMKKWRTQTVIVLFALWMTSCGRDTEPVVDCRYAETKTERTQSVFSGEYGELRDSYTDSRGETYSLYCREQGEEKRFAVTRHPRESTQEQTIALQLDESANYRFVSADSAGNILLADFTTLYVFRNGAESSAISFPAWALGGMLPTEDNAVICQTYGDSPYYIFDLSTGASRGIYLETDFLFGQGSCQPFLCGSYGEELLYASGGIYEHAEDTWQLRVPAAGTSMSKAEFEARWIERGAEGTYIVCDSQYRYTYSPREVRKEEEEQQITLRVTSWQDRSTLKSALAQYQIENPNVTIDYTFRCSDLPETEQEANILIQQTNAELVSSKAADLYVLDCLPWEQYRDKGYLMDLSDIVKPYAEDEDYFGNILTAYGTEDGLYAVPWFFSVRFILCREELVPYVQSIHTLASWLEEHPQEPGLVPYYYRDRPELFLAMMYDFYGKDLYGEEQITLESVEKFLASAKIIYDRQQENTDAAIEEYTPTTYTYLQQYPCGTDCQLLLEEGEGNLVLFPSTPMGIGELLEVCQYPDFAIVPMEGIHSRFLFGIHTESREKEAAAQLLEYLLSYFEETGRADRSIEMFGFLPGLPVYEPVLSGQIEFWYPSGEAGTLDPAASLEEAQLRDSCRERIENLQKLFTEFHEPGYSADAITDDVYSIFEERSRGYLTGEKTLQQAADEVYNGLLLFYQENQVHRK